MDYATFLMGLLLVSTLTGLVTEALKRILQEINRTVPANLLAGAAAVVVALAVAAGYMVLTEAALNAKAAVYLIALVFLSWLCAMAGYDKVVQALAQLRGKKGE